jgi:hypothetical protein
MQPRASLAICTNVGEWERSVDLYYFDIVFTTGLRIVDENGAEFPDAEAARNQAVSNIRDQAEGKPPPANWFKIEISNSEGVLVATVEGEHIFA